jgi:hypothetical protein
MLTRSPSQATALRGKNFWKSPVNNSGMAVKPKRCLELNLAKYGLTELAVYLIVSVEGVPPALRL